MEGFFHGRLPALLRSIDRGKTEAQAFGSISSDRSGLTYYDSKKRLCVIQNYSLEFINYIMPEIFRCTCKLRNNSFMAGLEVFGIEEKMVR